MNNKLIVSLIIAVGTLSLLFFYNQQQQREFQKMELNLKERELLLQEEKQKQELFEIEKKSDIEEKIQLEELKLKQEKAKKEAEAELEEAEFNAWVSECIIKSQSERDRRKANLYSLPWLPEQDVLDQLEDIYQEWKDSCERGVETSWPWLEE
jgi:low affinity Fe/Cu permease